ncbi:MAG: response regulator [Verrucomicrobiota bacterium]
MIVEDSECIRQILTTTLSRAAHLDVVGAAEDVYRAREMIVEHAPDVLTLDLAMPRMDGLTFLKRLMEHHPLPVVIVSSLTRTGSDLAQNQ